MISRHLYTNVSMKNACNSMGGHLLEIQNAREDNWIALQTNKRGRITNYMIAFKLNVGMKNLNYLKNQN